MKKEKYARKTIFCDLYVNSIVYCVYLHAWPWLTQGQGPRIGKCPISNTLFHNFLPIYFVFMHLLHKLLSRMGNGVDPDQITPSGAASYWSALFAYIYIYIYTILSDKLV